MIAAAGGMAANLQAVEVPQSGRPAVPGRPACLQLRGVAATPPHPFCQPSYSNSNLYPLISDCVFVMRCRPALLCGRVDSNPSMCQLDVLLLYEVFDSPDAQLLYPVNALRNLARMQVGRKDAGGKEKEKLVCRIPL